MSAERLMRAKLAIFAVAALVSCTTREEAAAEKLEREYQIIRDAGGSDAEKCKAAERARDAWLAALDQERYEQSKFRAAMQCGIAK